MPAGAEYNLRIGKLAEQAGVNPKTVRYYEQIGLFPAARRAANGYRLYTAADLQRLRFIAKARKIGLSLEEIRDILSLRDSGEQPCKHVVALLGRKVTEVDEYMRALSDFRQELIRMRQEAAENVSEGAHYCRIIERHEGARHDTQFLSTLSLAPHGRHHA